MEDIVRLEERHYDFFESRMGMTKWIVDRHFNDLSEPEKIEEVQEIDDLIERDNAFKEKHGHYFNESKRSSFKIMG